LNQATSPDLTLPAEPESFGILNGRFGTGFGGESVDGVPSAPSRPPQILGAVLRHAPHQRFRSLGDQPSVAYISDETDAHFLRQVVYIGLREAIALRAVSRDACSGLGNFCQQVHRAASVTRRAPCLHQLAQPHWWDPLHPASVPDVRSGEVSDLRSL
jgi:hypothetical protein